MRESSGDQIPAGIKIRKAIDKTIYGSEGTEYFHSKPISKDRALDLREKLRTKGLKSKEVRLLSEYERAQVYEQNNSGIGKVLVLASGYDGIPAHVFGKERTIMSSLETGRYFSPYLSFLGRTAGVKKIEADMFKIPVVSRSFSTLVINEMDVFNRDFMDKISDDEENTTADPTIQLFNEARRLIEEGGKFIVTSERQGFKALDEETKREIELNGWKLENRGSLPILAHYVFKAVKVEK